MSEAELRAECRLLTQLQKQYDEAAANDDNTLLIHFLGTSNKHVYSKALAKRVVKTISRALEMERLDLMNRNKKYR